VAEVIKTLHTNAKTSKKVAAAIVGKLHAAVQSGTIISDVEGSMQYSIITQPQHQKVEDRQKLSYILPYFKD